MELIGPKLELRSLQSSGVKPDISLHIKFLEKCHTGRKAPLPPGNTEALGLSSVPGGLCSVTAVCVRAQAGCDC